MAERHSIACEGNCAGCGRQTKRFASSGKCAKWCSAHCAKQHVDWSKVKRKPRLRAQTRVFQRKCVGCGRDFAYARRPKGGLVPRYCSRVCWEKSNRCTYCSVHFAHCSICGAAFASRRPSTICGRTCRMEAERRRARAYQRTAIDRSPRMCKHCGKQFSRSMQHGRGKSRRCFCTDRCADRFYRRGIGSHRARARRRGVPYEPVNRLQVFTEYNYRCACCGRQCYRGFVKRGSNRQDQPELDHIIPLASPNSPGHVRSNVQLLCRACNHRKGAAEGGKGVAFLSDSAKQRTRRKKPASPESAAAD